MSRFIDLNGEFVNVDFIRRAWKKREKRVVFEMDDGQEIGFDTPIPEYYLEELSGKNHIVQIIHPKIKMYDVFRNDDGTFDAYQSIFLAICSDGEVRSVGFGDGYIDFAETCSNYEGVFPKDSLQYHFENIEINDEEIDIDNQNGG